MANSKVLCSSIVKVLARKNHIVIFILQIGKKAEGG